ncbi:MAG: alpha/beta hydrolase [Cryobacterium sp.]|nr:alpha/beta hydrolase [Cryobacterium sp.]
MRVYVHGAGSSGRDAWPFAPDEGAVFADLAGMPSVASKLDALAELVPEGAVVLAHSWGAIPVVLAVAERRIQVARLVLLEPALYDVARGAPAVERHIASMTEARAHASDGRLFEYWSIVRPLMFGGPADRGIWDSEQAVAARFAAIEPPWGYDLAAEMVSGVPTVVITGGWNDEYEAIAAALTSAGAVHRQLVGARHRPQDHPDFERLLLETSTG